MTQLIPSLPPAILALEDDSIFFGHSIGAPGRSHGEVVFNTAMTGYQEILTDPSYALQLITFTYPHIGNVGINQEDCESNKIYANGIIIKDLSLVSSNFRSKQSLNEYLQTNQIIGIAGIDTRKLTRILREKGTKHGVIIAGKIGDSLDNLKKLALRSVRSFTLVNQNVVESITTKYIYQWKKNTSNFIENKKGICINKEKQKHVIVYDFGSKYSILRILVQKKCKVTVVPSFSIPEEILDIKPDGIVFSNGPGDPKYCKNAITAAKTFLYHNIPLFGICLGHQIMCIAAGGEIIKMKFGHHGSNHPVKDLNNGKVIITTQNHCFAVNKNTLPKNLKITHLSLFDYSLQGLIWRDRPALCFQGHPEGSPGPDDISYLFDQFIQMM